MPSTQKPRQERRTPDEMRAAFLERKAQQVAELLYQADKLSDYATLVDLPMNLREEYLTPARLIVTNQAAKTLLATAPTGRVQ